MKRRPQVSSPVQVASKNRYAAAEVRKDRQITSEISSRNKGRTNGTRKPKKKMTPKRVILTVGVVLICLLLVSVGAVFAYMRIALNNINYNTETLSSDYNLPTESLVNPPQVVPGITNILLLGVDNREVDAIDGRSDAMMILTIDTINNKIKLTSLQRDMLVYIPGHSAPNKINSANAFGGPLLALRVVNDIFRLNIEKYVIINMSGLEELVDIVGGVNIDVDPTQLDYLNEVVGSAAPKLTAAGMQLLTGHQAIMYARLRHLDSDYKRMERQRAVLQALFTKFKDADLGVKNNMMNEGLKLITTNLSADEIMSIGFGAIPLVNGDIEQLQLPITGTFHSGYLNGTSWVNWCDYNKMIPKLQEFIFGETAPFDKVKLIPESMIFSSQTQATTESSATETTPSSAESTETTPSSSDTTETTSTASEIPTSAESTTTASTESTTTAT